MRSKKAMVSVKAMAAVFLAATMITMAAPAVHAETLDADQSEAVQCESVDEETGNQALSEEKIFYSTLNLDDYPDHPDDTIDPALMVNLYRKGNEINKYSLNSGDVVYMTRKDVIPAGELVEGIDVVKIINRWEERTWLCFTVTTFRVLSLTKNEYYTFSVPDGPESPTYFYQLDKIADKTDSSILDTGNLEGLMSTDLRVWYDISGFLAKANSIRNYIKS